MKNAGLIFLALLLFGSGFVFAYFGYAQVKLIPATQEEVENLASEKFEIRLGNLHKTFETQDDYLAFVDSLSMSTMFPQPSKIRFAPPSPNRLLDLDFLKKAKVETLRVVEFVDRAVDCIPRIVDSEYVFRFQHVFEDGLQIYGTVGQNEFAFYDAHVKKLSFYLPEQEIRIRKGFFGSWAGKLALVTLSGLAGYGLANLR